MTSALPPLFYLSGVGEGEERCAHSVLFHFFVPACETDFRILESCVMTSPINDSQ